jgi:uncharacterized protein (DUF2126 family)/transglutaminase-like putative cysteine protease
MTIRVALNHRTSYRYDRLITLAPQVIRLRPAQHSRTPIPSYSLRVLPADHFLNWQQDPHGNFLARCVFPQPTRELRIEVDLVADMTVINPFDFFLEEETENYPFAYDISLERELRPFLEIQEQGSRLEEYVQAFPRDQRHIVNVLVELNRRLQEDIQYLIRLEPGVQSPEQTLTLGSGSCRDSAWLLVNVLRRLGLAARFVSGYLIQLTADIPALEGPSGPDRDFTDLHAWTEVYLPGAGWVGLDPTSGLFAGEGHIPLACTPDPQSAAPITGKIDPCEVTFDFSMSVTRIHEDPRVTKPYDESQWQAIYQVGLDVDRKLDAMDVRLTMGGEPTFVSIDDMEGAEWNVTAVGTEKKRLSEVLIKRLRARFAPAGLLHYGQGKWYPGESLPRWALACFWRKDGVPIWQNPDLIVDSGKGVTCTPQQAEQFGRRLAERLEVDPKWLRPAFEDIAHYLWKERRLPVNVDPRDAKLADPEERARISAVFERGLGNPRGHVLPICRQWQQAKARWTSGPWPLRGDHLFLLPGDSPIGLRLPLDGLPWEPPLRRHHVAAADPLAPRPPLPSAPPYRRQPLYEAATLPNQDQGRNEQVLAVRSERGDRDTSDVNMSLIRTAMCLEVRQGALHVFFPPVEYLEDYLDLVHAIELTAEELQIPVVLEGYLPPPDERMCHIKVTPDPGVIEVNVHPAASWSEIVTNTTALYEEARLARLGTEKFDLDGKHTGTGGGNHIVLGGATPIDSPFLRRPDLLKSLLGYWVNHPSLSYLFSGRFIGPTSQAPRVDEGRRDALYELNLAFSLVPTVFPVTSTEGGRSPGEANSLLPPWLVDRIFRDLLTDGTGNTHRAEFCIDKLYSPDSSSGRLGLVELRAMEMPPHARMSLTQQLLVRALIAWFWQTPYQRPLISWETTLHDRYMLPHYVWQDLREVLGELRDAGTSLDDRWFSSHFEFRFPRIGEVYLEGLSVELRSALEPWYVLGEEPATAGTVRYVDSSVERLQVKVQGMVGDRFMVCCNQRQVPLQNTGVPGEFVAGVRYRAWQPPHCLHPTIPVHTPLVIDVLDTWSGRSIGGCTYHVSHPAGRNYDTFPVNAQEAEARRGARFFPFGHTPGSMKIPAAEPNSSFPMTLDLRRARPWT